MEVAIPEISSAESPITQKLKLVKEKETPPFVTDKIRKFHHATAIVIDTYALDKDLDLREDETKYLGQMIEYHLAKKSLLSLNQIPPTQQDEQYIEALRALKSDELLPELIPSTPDHEYRYLHSISFAALEFVNILFPELGKSISVFQTVESIFSQQNISLLTNWKDVYRRAKMEDEGERYGFKAYKLRIAEDRARLGIPPPKHA